VSLGKKEPLIYAAFGSLISADQRNDSQRKSAVPSAQATRTEPLQITQSRLTAMCRQVENDFRELPRNFR